MCPIEVLVIKVPKFKTSFFIKSFHYHYFSRRNSSALFRTLMNFSNWKLYLSLTVMNYDNKSDFNDEEEKTNLGSSGRQGGFDKFTLQSF